MNIMESNFQKSWSIHGYNKINNECHNKNRGPLLNRPTNFDRTRPEFQSTRSTKTNLQQRFKAPEECFTAEHRSLHFQAQNSRVAFDENDHPFYLKNQNGLRFRSLTDSNIRQFEVNGVTKSCNEAESPRSSFIHPFRQLPERIGPIFSNIHHTVSQAGPKTEKFFQKGGKKVQKALQGVCTSLNSFSQRFKQPTRRRYKLENTPSSHTPNRTPSRAGRITPGKLYSPFDVNTPRTPYSYMKGPKRLQNGHVRRNMLGQENFGLCRTPPNHLARMPLKNWTPSPSNQNWTQVSSLAPANFSQNQRTHYRLDSAFPPIMNEPQYVNVPPVI